MVTVEKKYGLKDLFFYVVIIEIVIGGSGRMIEFGPLSLKMVLFAIALIISFFSLREVKSSEVFKIQTFFIITLLTSFLVAIFNRADPPAFLEDMKPLLFIFMINYFAINIKTRKDIEIVTLLIKRASLIMAIIYLLTVLALFLGVLNFTTFYEQQSEGSEIMFRNEYFFLYKGFLYLGIGFFFCLLSIKKLDKLFALILFIALALTLTRGFILAALLLFAYYVFFLNKSISLKSITIVLGVVSFIYFLPLLFDTLGDKSDSDMIRITNINEVLDALTIPSFFIGHGFGIGVPIRPVHMEISYLEIFHKQGIFGLSFWIFLFVFLVKKYIQLKIFKKEALPYVLSVGFVYLQSFTNPFINNPIGISITLISIVVLIRLKEEEDRLNFANYGT
ncbi:O-antigen ligase [Sphingobacterium sp. BN32]|uniref:O-antigen ligase family protein n=1 Tax=Sphingobacterium sp. BN32 TaxID=3058432 RepID=UPI00265CF25B|nr:hypothetical protein [Sphingobacterium sp. BN32]WKK58406.1 hypothetical protein QYC40_17400 [Sphingobacterium sp. BN32]